ncbi:MAG: iron-sulfur cluster repair di-iron protein [Bryobacteraceae bacterium]|nr:MAG: iron-sulfur cluster repair di-iron protein [Bryobacteraceae bacterium]
MTWSVWTPLADLAASSTAAVRILEQHGLDYCCGGARPLAEAAREKGLAPEAVIEEIEKARTEAAGERDWRMAPLTDLIGHILRTHHEYLKLNLPALAQRLRKVQEVHGGKDPALLQSLGEVYGALRTELEDHMHKEEVILFPFIERYQSAAGQGLPLPPVPFGTIANPIRVMEREHESAGGALARLRELTGGYTVPEWACDTVRALWRGLEELEQDLHMHIHLENNILFPRAMALEAGA